MKTFLVGNLYRVEAEDEEHAFEQYIDAIGHPDSPEINYIREER